MSFEDDEDEVDLSVLGYDQIAGYFSDKALEVEDVYPSLMEPLLYAAKAIMALKRLNSKKVFGQHHMETWRRNATWMVYCKGRITEEVAKLEREIQNLRSDLEDEAYKTIVRKGLRISDDKVKGELRKNKKYRGLDSQLSELRAILTHVLDHCDQFRLIKDVLVQESTLTKHMMAP